MLSFSTPCFKYKLFAAYKTHWGFTGFKVFTPVPNRYLQKTIRLVLTLQFTGGGGVIQDTTMTFIVDRVTGAETITEATAVGTDSQFPDPSPHILTDPRWSINGDSSATFDVFNSFADGSGGQRTQYFVNLSNAYTLTELEDDVDTLLSAIDPSTVPLFNLLQVAMPGDSIFPARYLGSAIPGAHSYPDFGNLGLSVEPKLKAAALCAYLPSLPSNSLEPVGGLLKLASMISMAGNYCEKTYFVDYNVQLVGTPLCGSGIGSCAGWFTVRADAVVAGQIEYVLVIPDCRCR